MTTIRFQRGAIMSMQHEWPTVPRVGEHVAVMDEQTRMSGVVRWVAWKPDGTVVVELTLPFGPPDPDA